MKQICWSMQVFVGAHFNGLVSLANIGLMLTDLILA